MKFFSFSKWCRVAVALVMFSSAAQAVTVRPEHPRPDALRTNWATLNGQWEFEIDEKADGESRGLTQGKQLKAAILVPFCPESELSGVGNKALMRHVWYRRHFELPPSMKNNRVRLHFGAVDYQAWVWVNGQLAGTHTGGSVGFALDVTTLVKDGQNELVVRVFDDTASGRQPTGKQTHTVSEGCVYTRTTGIWQPVWLEAVGSSFVESFSVKTDPDGGRVLIDATINGADTNLVLTAEAFAGGKAAGKESIPVSWRGNQIVLELKEKKLWGPGTPFLYDLKLTLASNGRELDELSSYFGLRKIEIQGRAILINGQRVFQRLILDQGFYPDGIWTARSDDELRKDIERSMAAGFNGARLHQKVFEPRFLYWADKLGYLVWGEFPNWGFNYRPENYRNYINEWTEILVRDRNHPSIVGWSPFNETPGEAGELQDILVRQTRVMDPTRPVLETSGWTHLLRNAEVRDDHDYNQDPAGFKRRWDEFFQVSERMRVPARYNPSNTPREDLAVPFMVSEFGGAFWGETQGGWGYGSGPRSLEEFYTRYEGLVNALLDNPNMFGFCYTQLTDVEQEKNGLYFYDRRPKFDLKRLHSITAREAAYEKTGPTAPPPSRISERSWQILVGARPDGANSSPYRYTTNQPAGDWTATYDDASWPEGMAPFGNDLPNIRTPWNTSQIWLRKTFEAQSTEIKSAALVIFYDEDTEVFVNGQRIWSRTGFTTSYDGFVVTEALRRAIKPGKNCLAVHTRQTGGGQFLDLALLYEPTTGTKTRLTTASAIEAR